MAASAHRGVPTRDASVVLGGHSSSGQAPDREQQVAPARGPGPLASCRRPNRLPYTERPAVALNQIGVRPAWRRTGTARRIDDALLAARDEPYVTLVVNPAT